MELQMLLEQKESIKDRIKKAISKTKKWFEDKMKSTKDTFDDIKYKVQTKLSKVTKSMFKNKVVSEEIIVKSNGKETVLANTGDNAESIFEKIKRLLNTLISTIKDICTSIIKQCSDAISSLITIEKIDYEAIERAEREEALRQAKLEEIQIKKEKVMDGLKSVTEVVIVVGSLLTAIVKLKDASKKLMEDRRGK